MPERAHKKVIPVESPEDMVLLQDFLAGSEEAFTAIYDRFYPPLFGLACRYVSVAEAEDVCAECFAKLWQLEKDFNSIRGLRVYFAIMIRNACISIRRKKRTAARREAEFSSLYDTESPGDVWEEERVRLYEAMAKLPPQARKIMVLSVVNEWKYIRIAQNMGISHSAVRAQKTRSLKLLRGLLTAVFYLFLQLDLA